MPIGEKSELVWFQLVAKATWRRQIAFEVDQVLLDMAETTNDVVKLLFDGDRPWARRPTKFVSVIRKRVHGQCIT
jgi:hypothetical protein